MDALACSQNQICPPMVVRMTVPVLPMMDQVKVDTQSRRDSSVSKSLSRFVHPEGSARPLVNSLYFSLMQPASKRTYRGICQCYYRENFSLEIKSVGRSVPLEHGV